MARPLVCGVVSAMVSLQTHAATTPDTSKPAGGKDVQIPARENGSVPAAPPSVEGDANQAASLDNPNANPYAIIVDRNVFRLVPIPPPPAPDPPKIDVPTVNLSGFRKTSKDLWVYLAMKPKDPKEPWQYFSMREGDKAGKEPNTLELVKVHENAGAVDIVNTGQPMTLTLKSNSFTSAPSSPAPGGRAAENLMRARRMMGGQQPGAPPAAAVPYTPAVKSSGATAIGLSTDNTVVNAGAQNIPQAQGYGAAAYGAQPTYYGNGGTQVAGAQPQVTTPNGASIDLNPSVPQRTPQAQQNWPPQQPAGEAEQAAALLLHEAAGGPPAPPIPGVNDEGTAAPNVPVVPRFGPR